MSTALATLRETLKQNLQTMKESLPASSSKRIQITQDKRIIFPDGTQTDKPFDAVILDWRFLNVLYTKRFVPGQTEAPDCWALSKDAHLLAPGESVAKPKHTDCATCPMNQWGSNGNGKACGNKVRVAIAPADAGERTSYSLLTVSPTGITPFTKYLTALLNAGKHPMETITTIGLATDKTYASLRFAPAGAAPENEHFARLFAAAQADLDRGFDFD